MCGFVQDIVLIFTLWHYASGGCAGSWSACLLLGPQGFRGFAWICWVRGDIHSAGYSVIQRCWGSGCVLYFVCNFISWYYVGGGWMGSLSVGLW